MARIALDHPFPPLAVGPSFALAVPVATRVGLLPSRSAFWIVLFDSIQKSGYLNRSVWFLRRFCSFRMKRTPRGSSVLDGRKVPASRATIARGVRCPPTDLR